MPQALLIPLGALIQTATAGLVATVTSLTSALSLTSLAKLGLSIGLSLLAQALLPGPQTPKPQEGQVNIRQPIPKRRSGFGEGLTGGAYMLYELVDGTSYDVLAMHSGRIDSISRYFLNNNEVTVGIDGVVEHEEFYGSAVRIFTRLGLNTETAYSEVVSGIGNADIWNSNCRGDEIASLALICEGVGAKALRKTYPDGQPSPLIVARFQRYHDPRVSDSDQDTPSTHSWGSNPVWQLAHYIAGERCGGGMALSWAKYIQPRIDEWITAADLCDQLIALDGGGTEPRYASHGTYDHEAQPAAVIRAILSTFDGWLYIGDDGALGIKAGQYVAPADDVVLRREHILSFAPEIGVPRDRVVSVLRARYTSPDHLYSEQDADEWRDEELIDQYGELSTQADLLWVQSHTQVRRLMKRLMTRLNAPRRGTIVADMMGLNLIGERYFRLRCSDIPGFENLICEVVDIELDPKSLQVIIKFVQADPNIDAWDPATEEGTPPAIPEKGAGLALPAPEDFDVDLLGEDNRPYFQVKFDQYGNAQLSYEVQYSRFSDSGSPGAWESEVYEKGDVNTSGGRTRIETGTVDPDELYRVRAAAISPAGFYSNYTSPQYVFTGFTGSPDTPADPVATAIGGGQVEVDMTAPATPDWVMMRVWRASGAQSFGDAVDVSGQILLEGGASTTFLDTGVPTGSRKYWLTAEVANNRRSSNSGSDTVTVT